jgi:S-adenosylmethionine synthetase
VSIAQYASRDALLARRQRDAAAEPSGRLHGPGAPIGGGALCGKDPPKVDRKGALSARQHALRLVRDAGAREATVRLGFLPGLRAPAFLDALVDGRPWERRRIERAIAVPDLSLEGSFRDLELASVRWADVLARGYFGGDETWER